MNWLIQSRIQNVIIPIYKENAFIGKLKMCIEKSTIGDFWLSVCVDKHLWAVIMQ